MTFTAWIGLGANLGEPDRQLIMAVAALDTHPALALDAVSRLYRSAPIGPAGQPDYANAAVRLRTDLTPHSLLRALQAIENAAGRVRAERWGPRLLDLDLLLFEADEIRSTDLTVPHPELVNRAFVIQPLLDLDPALALPNGTKLASLQAATEPAGLSVVADSDWWRSR